MRGCRKCSYWQGVGEELDRDDPELMGKKVEFGLCRRYAPHPGAQIRDANGGDAQDSVWPKVASDEWCGEWQPDVN